MISNYEALKRFLQTQLIDKGLEFNPLKTTKSAPAALLRGFREKGWSTERTFDGDRPTNRYTITDPSGSGILNLVGGKVYRHPEHTETICRRKHLTKRMLDFAGLPTAAGADFARDEFQVARAFFTVMPKPIVVKATDSGGSKGVTVGVFTEEDFDQAWDHALKAGRSSSNILLEEFVSGVELRAFVVGTRVVSVVARLQPFVVGDGKSSVNGLIDALNEKRSVNYRAVKMPLKVNWPFVGKQGHDETSVPDNGEIVFLNPFNIPSVGGLLLDVTDVVASQIKDIAQRAVATIPGLETAGVDLLVDDLKDESTASIIEVNTAAALDLHRYPTHGGNARAIEVDIVDYFHEQYKKSLANDA